MLLTLLRSPRQAPVVTAAADITNAVEGTSTATSATATDADGTIVSYAVSSVPALTFSGTGNTRSFVPPTTGTTTTYTITWTATDNDSLQGSDTQLITVLAAVANPVVVMSPNQTGIRAGALVRVYATATTAQGVIANYNCYSPAADPRIVITITGNSATFIAPLSLTNQTYTIAWEAESSLAAIGYAEGTVTVLAATERWAVAGAEVAAQFRVPRVNVGPVAGKLDFAGYSWNVRPVLASAGPGPNAWGDTINNAWVDDKGHLTLQIFKDAGNVWRCVELGGPALGYGQYTWTVETNPANWQVQPVLGLFTYDETDNGANNYREIDIEFSKWTYAPEPSRIWYSVQPTAGFENRFADHGSSANTPYTCTFIWQAGQVYFRTTDSTGKLLGEHMVTDGVPNPGTAATVRMNLWLVNGVAPGDGQNVAMKMSNFKFTPNVTRALTPAASTTMDFANGIEQMTIKSDGVVGGPKARLAGRNLAIDCVPAYSSSSSGNVFDITGSSAYIEVAGLPLFGNYTQEAFYFLMFNPENNIIMFFAGGGMYGRVRLNGVNTQVSLGNEDLPNQKYWRIREAAGTVYFDFSVNSTTWIQAGSLVHGLPAAQLKTMRMRLVCGHYGAETSPTPFLISGINLP